MEMYTDEIKKELDHNPQYREMLFRRGYLFTDKKLKDTQHYPFYGLWKEYAVGQFWLYVHQAQTVYSCSEDYVSSVIVGHAYNPFNMQCDENLICEELIQENKKNKAAYFEKISELTGLHIIILIEGDRVTVCQDACSLTGCYFGKVKDTLYISEHPQMLADICGLKMDPMVKKLINSKCYNVGNRHLPGNKTPYKELKRLGANTYLDVNGDFLQIRRFYPIAPHPEFTTKQQQEQGVAEIARLIHNGIECCTKKWENATISLSGGTDSKTTLACASGLYEKFSYFSFSSKPQETVDANGAKKLCDQLGLAHMFYKIPENNEDIPDFDFIKKLLQHNTNYIVKFIVVELFQIIDQFVKLCGIFRFLIKKLCWCNI